MNCYLPRKSTAYAFFLRMLMEKYRKIQRDLQCVFVDLEEETYRVPQDELWYWLKRSEVAEKYTRIERKIAKCSIFREGPAFLASDWWLFNLPVKFHLKSRASSYHHQR